MDSKLLKRTLLIVTGLFLQNNVNAQMYVSPNSYVFANNQVVFVKQQLELNAASSNFYLRADAQLVQGSELQRTDSQSKNKGLGSLSVFQEGTRNNYQFDYWCSPVGGSNAIAGNSAFGITQLKDIVDVTNSANSTPLAMNNYNGTASPFAIAPYWIFKLTASSNYSDWIQVGTTSNINAGEGFTMKGSSGTNSTTVNGVQNNPGGVQR